MNNFNLTYSQAKEVINAGQDIREFIEQVNDQPEWLQHMGVIEDVAELKAILQGGCASGAYMPAVTYFTAFECYKEHGDQMFEFLYDHGIEDMTFDFKNETVAGFAVKICSLAVESWVGQFEGILESIESY